MSLMKSVRLFDGISQDSINAMVSCFKMEQRHFRRGDTILVFSQELEYLCVLLSGKAHLYCTDSEGDYTMLEAYHENDIFGEVFAMPYGDLGYAVEADSECTVMFIRFSCIYGRCPNACQHHTQLTHNLFELSAEKAQSLSMRINLISKKSLRRKLMAYFEYLSERSGSSSFELDMSLSRLAGFLCVDRTSMTRELKNMCDDGLIMRNNRKVTILRH